MKAPPIHQVDLFRQGEHGVHTYRIPALIETLRGDLLAVVDARHDNDGDLPGRISLVMRRSADRGHTWSPPHTLLTVPEGGVGDASLLLDRSGRIWCFHAYGPPGIGFLTARPGSVTGPDVLQVRGMWSDDDGGTWSRPVDFTPQIKNPSWHAIFATSGTHYQTSRGRYLIPMVVRDENKRLTARNAYSDDLGKTWKIGPSIAPDTDESKAVELAGGTIVQNMRNGKLRVVARSYDGGVTFGAPAHDRALVDPSCNAGLARYRSGRHDLVLFSNAASDRRENLTVRASHDEGRTWREACTIHAGPSAYSTLIALRDGTIAMLYERGEKHPASRITFARMSLDWILGR